MKPNRKKTKLILDQDELRMILAPQLICNESTLELKPRRLWDLEISDNAVAIISDASREPVLGKLAREAALFNLERKALLYKEFADLQAFPLCIQSENVDDVVRVIQKFVGLFAGINLDEMSDGRGVAIEQSLADVGIPVFLDDLDGFAVVFLTALLNSLQMAHKQLEDIKIVINGFDPQALEMVHLLTFVRKDNTVGCSVKDILINDEAGIIARSREDIINNDSPVKNRIAHLTNNFDIRGNLKEALAGADVYIEINQKHQPEEDLLRHMNRKSVVILLHGHTSRDYMMKIHRAGAFVVCTQDPHYPNYLNSDLVFPGILRGAIDVQARRITPAMKMAAAGALAQSVSGLHVEHVLPVNLEKEIVFKMAKAVSSSQINGR